MQDGLTFELGLGTSPDQNFGGKCMTWSEIKTAVEQSGVKDNDSIVEIHCELHNGAKTLHQIRLGKFIKLTEDFSESARGEASGCCV
jgi:hypothetical protein